MFLLCLFVNILFVLTIDVFAEDTPQDRLAEAFSYPIPGSPKVTQDFWDLVYDPYAYHLGEDIRVGARTIVRSAADGYVAHAAHHPPRKGRKTNYGGMVIIESDLLNGETITHFYAHGGKKQIAHTSKEERDKALEDKSYSILVLTGMYVKKGDPIMRIGTKEENVGFEEHLHFGIRKGKYDDPGGYYKLKNSLAKPFVKNSLGGPLWYYGGYVSWKLSSPEGLAQVKSDFYNPSNASHSGANLNNGAGFIEFYNSHGYPPGGSPSVGPVVRLNHNFTPGSYHKEADSPTVYLAYKDDRLWPIFSGEVLFALTGKLDDYSMVENHPARSLEAYRKGPTIGKVGSLYKTSTAPDVYLVTVDEYSRNLSGQIVLGNIRPIKDGETFRSAGFNWDNILVVPESFLSRYIRGGLFSLGDIQFYADASDEPAQFVIAGGLGDALWGDIPITTVYVPNGSEIWQAGTTQRIVWTARDDVGIENVSLYYSSDDGLTWQTITTLQGAQTTQYSWTVPNTVSSSSRIQVAAYDAVGNLGLDQSDGVFTISGAEGPLPSPALYEPSVSGQNYTIAWTGVSGAQNYLLQEDTTPSFANPVEYNTNMTARYFSNRAEAVYYYRVSAVNNQGRGAWSNTKYVVVNSHQPPGEITNMSPPNGATNQPLSVTLSWNSVHPAGESVRYNVWFATADVNFFVPSRLVSAQQTGTTYTISNLPYNTICSWKIEAIDETGDTRESPVFHFTTVRDNAPPTGGITINNGVATTNTYSVALQLSASDGGESGIGWMRLSNDGVNWSSWLTYSNQYSNWNLTDSNYGGKPGQTTYTVYAQFKDKQGNPSTTYSDTIDKATGTPGNIILHSVSYQTIKDAVAAAATGDTVLLTPGVYTIQGALNPPRYPSRYVGLVMKPGVTLMGAGADKTELILETGWYTVVDADNVVIQGVTISGGGPVTVRAESKSFKIAHCRIKGASEAGIEITTNGSNIEVSNNLILNNDIGISNGGSNTKFFNNIIAFNSSGIADGTGNAIFKNNLIVFNNLKGATIRNGTVFHYNNVFGNRTGNYYTGTNNLPDQTGINGNISADPLFVNVAASDYRLGVSSPCINTGTDVGIPVNGSPDMGAFEYNGSGTIRVEANHSKAAFTITGPQTYTGSGIGWSMSGVPIGIYSIAFSPVPNHNTPLYTSKVLRSGETLVFNGYYTPDVEPPECNISLNYGEYATADSIVDIALSASDKVAGLGAGAQMQFSNDGTTWSSVEPYSTVKPDWDLIAYGGDRSSGTKMVYAKVSDALGNFTAAITDTIFYVPNHRILEVPYQFSTVRTAIDSAQAGDMVWVAPGSYREDVVLKPGIRLQGAGPKLTTLAIASNAIRGADNCVVDGFTLTGGFVLDLANASPIISNNIIRGSFRGITVWGDSHPIIRNCVITSSATDGISVEGHPDRQTAATIENCTIYNNNTGISVVQAQANTLVEVVNSVIANNQYGIKDNPTDFEHTHIFSSFNLFWNNVNGNLTGQNKDKISSIADEEVDPKFTDAANGDFSLRSDSPAINAGNPETKYADIDGTPNDQGAYGGHTVNTSPVANFTSESQFGGLGSTFTFHASTSSDRETRMGGLNFRWDWENEGVFDTPFSTSSQITHSYQTLGEKSMTLQVRDAGGFVSSVTKQVTVNNQPPSTPSRPDPPDGTRGQPVNVTPPDTSLNQTGTLLLRWSATDADASDTLRYDLYFGSSPLAKIDSGLVDTSYTIAGLRRNTFYHWRVDAIDSHGARVEGAEWTLLTEPDPLPDAPENLNTSVLSYKTIQLGWGRKSAKALGYRIERKATSDTSFTLINVVAADSTLYVDQANLLGNTPYAYRVSAVNSSGRSPYSNEAAVTTDSDLLGDVNNDARVNISDALVAATYDLDSTITAPNRGTIPLGDVDYNDRVTITDALIIATYDIAPENPNLPFGIAESIFRSVPALKPLTLPAQSTGGKIIVEADAKESNPKPGDLVAVTLRIRMGDIPEKLGAYSARVQWNPSELNFVGYTGPERPAFDYSRVVTNAALQGQLRLNAFAVQGVGGDIELVHLQFRVLDELKSNPLKVEVTGLTAAQTFHDLLPAAQVKLPNLTALPSAFALYQNYPNPFNPQTVITFDVPQAAKIRIDVYNLLGQRIRVLLDKKVAAGRHQVFWDSRDEQGREVGNGLYIVRMLAGQIVLAKKIMVLK